MKKSLICFLSLLTAAFILLAVAGCGVSEKKEITEDSTGILPHSNEDISVTTPSETAAPAQDEKPSFTYNDENASWMKSGSLKVTLDGARLIEYRSDIPNEGMFVSGAFFTRFPHKTEDVFYYPNCFDSDGKFVEGAFLVLADVTFQNIDGVGYTKDDWGPDAVGVPENDPYIFNAGMLLRLANLKEPKVDGPFYRSWDIAYIDGPMDFRIEPGESISMTVGFLVCCAFDGSPIDRTQLELCYKAIEDRFVGLLEFENG